MAKDTCSIDGCTARVLARGWCSTHYGRWWKYGTTDDRPPQPHPRSDPESRFWPKVDVRGPDDCWLWQAACYPYGYGVFFLPRDGKRSTGAHRYSYELAHGPIPEGMHVCHHCDNPPCVNPTHLFLGTNEDNVQDRHQKGRTVSVGHPGESHWRSVLTSAQVQEIRTRYASGEMSQRLLGIEYGVTQSTVSVIVSGKRWGSLAI